MWILFEKIQKNLTFAIPVMMIIGLIFGYFFNPSFLKSLILPLTFLMVYPMMVNLQFDKIFTTEHISSQIVTQVINFGVIPFIAFFIGKLFFYDNPYFIIGLLLAALLPTSGMTISWTGFAKGNINSAIKMTVIGLILGSILTPLYIKFLMGTVVDIPLQSIFLQIILIIFLPMVMGYYTRKILLKNHGKEHYQKKIKMKFPAISTLGVLGIVFVAMALKANSILSNIETFLMYILPITGLYFLNYLISTFVGKTFFDRGNAIALVYGTVMRNLSIALAIAMTVFGEKGSEIAIIIAMAFIIQVQTAAWYVKFTNKIFGEPVTQN